MRVQSVDISDADKIYGTEDIIRKIKVVSKNKNELPDIPTCMKIMSMYFALVFKTVLAGFTFEIPKFGRVYVIKRDNLENEKKVKGMMKGMMKKKTPINFKRLGYFYSIFVDSPYSARGYYTFRADKEHRVELKRILVDTDFDYATTQI